MGNREGKRERMVGEVEEVRGQEVWKRRGSEGRGSEAKCGKRKCRELGLGY